MEHQVTLSDTCGAAHTLQVQKDHLLLDERMVIAVRSLAEQVVFATNEGEVACTAEACWYAFAGDQAIEQRAILALRRFGRAFSDEQMADEYSARLRNWWRRARAEVTEVQHV